MRKAARGSYVKRMCHRQATCFHIARSPSQYHTPLRPDSEARQRAARHGCCASESSCGSTNIIVSSALGRLPPRLQRGALSAAPPFHSFIAPRPVAAFPGAPPSPPWSARRPHPNLRASRRARERAVTILASTFDDAPFCPSCCVP